MSQPGRPDLGKPIDPPTADLVRGASRRARFVDRFAEIVITTGGLVVLAAMLGICLFLFNSAAPLLTGGEIEPATARVQAGAESRPVAIIPEAGDDHVIVLNPDATVVTIDFANAEVAGVRDLLAAEDADAARPVITSAAYDPAGIAVFGLADGRLAARTFEYDRYPVPENSDAVSPDGLDRSALERELRLAPGTLSPSAYVRESGSGERTVWDIALGELVMIDVAPGQRLERVHAHGMGAREWPFVALLGTDTMQATAEAVVGVVRSVRRLDGEGTRRTVRSTRFPLVPIEGHAPLGLFVVGQGDAVLAVYPDGTIQHYADHNGGWALQESVGLSLDGTARGATVARLALGGRSLLVGDDRGGVHRLMIAPPETPAGHGRVVSATAVDLGDAPVADIALQGQGRTIAVALQDATIAIVAPTAGQVIATRRPDRTQPTGAQPTAIGLAGSLDAIITLSADGQLTQRPLEAGHPDAGPRALFGPVWYEGYTERSYVYQSTGAPGAEPKFGLVPLIFGTLKATLAAMIIAVPLGVAGAIYTSEFLHADLRRVVKPTIELMASLPSVVLGFVAAIVIAPLARDILPGLLLGFAVIPLIVVLAAQLWRLVPDRITRRIGTIGHLTLVALVVALGGALAIAAAPLIDSAAFTPTQTERLVMAGVHEPVAPQDLPESFRRIAPAEASPVALDRAGIFVRENTYVTVPELPDDLRAELLEPTEGLGGLRRWLDGEFGGAWPGWMILMIPVATVVVLIGDARTGRLWHAIAGDEGFGAATVELVRLAVRTTATLALAAILATALTEAGFDARDSIFGPFSQRNTIVVGIAMGFAVIPIIYTISEDAMSSVPPSLRAASLGSGATPWQTAARVVLPVAASGIFSACMVGLGRAVGETMIVLMATGNTPEISANIFSGFRTLAANIAVELPEAPRGGTHYRVLFLCGLILFLMTLVINTTAELVRQHVRKKNAGL